MLSDLMPQPLVRAHIDWPDGSRETTAWLRDGHRDDLIDELLEAVYAVLNKRPGLFGAKITWERRQSEREGELRF